MIDAAVARLEELHPEQRETLQRLQGVRAEAIDLPFADFLEPRSFLQLSDKGPRLVAVTLPNVVAWVAHMAYSTRVRMLSLEPPILESLASGSLTPAMVLLRSHAETAGLACLSLLTLREGAQDQLVDLMQRTLFGSALARGWKAFQDLADLLPESESQPPTAKALMNALDAFVTPGGDGNGRYRAAYGLLCEYAHPNSRGMLGFARSVEEGPGWRIQYSAAEDVRRDGSAMALGLLLEMMRLGYAGSELLRHGTVQEVGGGFSITPPPPSQLRRILQRLMLLEAQGS